VGDVFNAAALTWGGRGRKTNDGGHVKKQKKGSGPPPQERGTADNPKEKGNPPEYKENLVEWQNHVDGNQY